VAGISRRKSPRTSSDPDQTRATLAYTVLILCAAGIIIFSLAAIWAAKSGDQRFGVTRLVFISVLPLFGTWVGTVLAFYFAGKNLETATATTQRLTEATARLAGVATAGTPVREKMIPWADMKALTISDAQAKDLKELPLETLWAELEKIRPLDRLPIVGPDRTMKGLAHRSLLTGFAARQPEPLPASLKSKKIKDLNGEEQRLLLETFAFVPSTTTLGEARTLMGAIPRCHDVIVTETGAPTEPVAGWLTDRDLATLSD
jgi:hypothetical protein